MASPQLAIAKASFTAVLLRQDPTTCPRPEIERFHTLLEAAITRCSPANVQKCKQWVLTNLIHSQPRVAALGKYMVALANSLSADTNDGTSGTTRVPSSKRRRLHILYILNDVLHHVHTRNGDTSFAQNIEPVIPGLFQSAAAFPDCPKHHRKVQNLLEIWEAQSYYTLAVINDLRKTVQDAPKLQETEARSESQNGNKNRTKEVPYYLPAMHGDPSTPWYDLPAANWLPVIEPNSTRPMNPEMIKPLQFMPGPADKELVKAVQILLADVDRIYARDTCLGDDSTGDIDPMGQRIIVDEVTGDVVDGETYYGWSRQFCEKMKQRRKKKANGSADDLRGRSRSGSRSSSRSRSRSSSRPAFKRRRMSSTSRSRSRSRNGSKNHGGRQSPTPDRFRRSSYSRSGSLSRSRSQDRRHRRSRSYSRSRSRDRQSPRPSLGQYDQTSSRPTKFQPSHPPPPGQWNHPQQSFPPPPPGGFNQFHPTPPPPPPNFSGQWPPPPPPPPQAGGPPPQSWLPPNVPAMGGWAPPPPPPLPPFPAQQDQYQGGQNHYRGGSQYNRGEDSYGRGGSGNYGVRGGRGGYNRGRGGW